MRKVLPIAAAVICGLYALVDFFVTDPLVDAIGAKLLEGVMILAAFALLLGLLNLLNVHLRRVATGEKNRGFSIVLVVAMLVTLVCGVAWPQSGALTWIFGYIYYPLQSSLAALLAFFAVSAAYRAFRLRSGQAVILLVTSLLVLVTQMPFMSAISPLFAEIREWVLYVPVAAGVRGLILGVALGTITTCLRVLLAVDRPYAGE